ncbi:MAG: hypothetical protein ACOZBL_01705 [Patescibacteria group bacterium]
MANFQSMKLLSFTSVFMSIIFSSFKYNAQDSISFFPSHFDSTS